MGTLGGKGVVALEPICPTASSVSATIVVFRLGPGGGNVSFWSSSFSSKVAVAFDVGRRGGGWQPSGEGLLDEGTGLVAL